MSMLLTFVIFLSRNVRFYFQNSTLGNVSKFFKYFTLYSLFVNTKKIYKQNKRRPPLDLEISLELPLILRLYKYKYLYLPLAGALLVMLNDLIVDF